MTACDGEKGLEMASAMNLTPLCGHWAAKLDGFALMQALRTGRADAGV